jgi:quercetin dioxygenase-like cupin family protein
VLGDSIGLRSGLYVRGANSIKRKDVEEEGAKKVRIQLLINQHRAATFVMRRFFVGPQGETPLHTHRWEHEVYVLKGRGIVTDGKAKYKLGPGTVVYIPQNKKHQFRNTGNQQLVFLCIIPK